MSPARCSTLIAAVALMQAACTERPPTGPGSIAMQSPAASSQTTVNAPSGLSATPASPKRMDVAWQDNSTNETGFEVRRSTDGSSGSFPVVATTAANVTSYADTGLAPGAQYCYKVRAVSTGRKTTSYSTLTEAVCAATPSLPPPPPPPPPAPPSAPSLGGVGVGLDQVVVTWIDNSSNEDGFRLERVANESTWVLVRTTAANIESATDVGVASEVQVCYRVVAFNSRGDSPSNTACGVMVNAPTNLTIDSLGFLTWTDNSAIEDSYEVWWMDAFGIAYDGLMATLPANTTSFVGGCSSCYGFTVFAVKDGAHSEGAVFYIPPAPPTNVIASAVSANEIDLTWTSPPNSGGHTAGEFMIERCTGNADACRGTGFATIAWTGSTSFNDVRVVASTTYTYRVTGWIGGLSSYPSQSVTAATP